MFYLQCRELAGVDSSIFDNGQLVWEEPAEALFSHLARERSTNPNTAWQPDQLRQTWLQMERITIATITVDNDLSRRRSRTAQEHPVDPELVDRLYKWLLALHSHHTVAAAAPQRVWLHIPDLKRTYVLYLNALAFDMSGCIADESADWYPEPLLAPNKSIDMASIDFDATKVAFGLAQLRNVCTSVLKKVHAPAPRATGGEGPIEVDYVDFVPVAAAVG